MRIGDICSIRSGLTLRERIVETRDGDAIAIQQADISRRGEFDSSHALRISGSIAAPHHHVTSQDLIFRSRGPHWVAWAPGYAAAAAEPLIAVAPLFIVTPTSDIDPAYLAWFINRPAAQRFFEAEAMGTGVKMIPKDVLRRLPIEAPPLDAQLTIAAAAALTAHERELSQRLTELRFCMASARLDASARATTAGPTASDTSRSTR